MRLILLLSLLFVFSPVYADFVKWVDKNGEVHYGTSIPPEYVDQAHVELNNSGMEVKHVGQAKTPQQLAQEKLLQEMRDQQKKLLEEQQARDRRLLTMYPNTDDLLMERDGKLAQLDSLVKYKREQIAQLKKRLDSLQAEAADLERRGVKMPPKLNSALSSTQQEISNARQLIAQTGTDKKELRDHYARDLARLKQLRGRSGASGSTPAENNAAIASDMDWTFQCQGPVECDSLWPFAVDYLRRHSTMPIKLQGAKIVVTQPPAGPDDIAITLSRLSAPGGDRLFLDVQCFNSPSGKALCASAKVKAIRHGFRHYLEQHIPE